MSEFSNILSQFIHEKNIKVYPLSKYCDFDRATMYKIINGKRNPPSRDIFEKMAYFMQLTPTEYDQFKEAYEISRVGSDNYYRRKSTENFLMHFPDKFSICPGSASSAGSGFKNDLQTPACASIHTQVELNYALRNILLAESSESTKGKVAMFMQPDYEGLFSLLSSLNLGYTLEIHHIFCLSNSEILNNDHELYNLEYFNNIFPLYLRNLNYQAYYFYDSIHSHFFNLNVLPYFIVTSRYAVSFSSDYQYGIFYSDPDIVAQFWKMFYAFQNKCAPLFQVFHMLPGNLHMLHNLSLNAVNSYLLQPEACLTPFITDRILEQALSPMLPERNKLLPVIGAFFSKNTENLDSMHVYFTKKGIQRFTQTGLLKEIPSEFYRPLLPTERLEMLQQLVLCCHQGTYRMLKSPLDQLPINLHLCVNETMGYFSFDNAENQTTYLMFNETGLLYTFLDYLQSLEETCFYTPEETADFINSEIRKLQYSQLYSKKETVLPPPIKNVKLHILIADTLLLSRKYATLSIIISGERSFFMSIMNTYTGRKFDPMHIKPENICLEDIAHALSYLCRGGGQTLIFYPVAQHCLNCAREAQSRGWSDRMVLACLLHDASEAYISDIIRPVKAHLSNYLEIEEMIMNVIWEKFNLNNLTSEEHAMWKQIDNDILSAELPVLFPGEKNYHTVPLQSVPDLSEHPFRNTEAQFLAAAHKLGIQ